MQNNIMGRSFIPDHPEFRSVQFSCSSKKYSLIISLDSGATVTSLNWWPLVVRDWWSMMGLVDNSNHTDKYSDQFRLANGFSSHRRLILHRLNVQTMYDVRKWERFQFLLDYEHQQARGAQSSTAHILQPVKMLWLSCSCVRLMNRVAVPNDTSW